MRLDRRSFLAGLAAALAAPAALADSIEEPGTNGHEGFDVVEDPIVEQMRRLDEIAPFEDLAPLWSYRNVELQGEVDALLTRLQLQDHVKKRRLAVAFDPCVPFDVTLPEPAHA